MIVVDAVVELEPNANANAAMRGERARHNGYHITWARWCCVARHGPTTGGVRILMGERGRKVFPKSALEGAIDVSSSRDVLKGYIYDWALGVSFVGSLSRREHVGLWSVIWRNWDRRY
jgi:hypothetical protein